MRTRAVVATAVLLAIGGRLAARKMARHHAELGANAPATNHHANHYGFGHHGHSRHHAHAHGCCGQERERDHAHGHGCGHGHGHHASPEGCALMHLTPHALARTDISRPLAIVIVDGGRARHGQ